MLLKVAISRMCLIVQSMAADLPILGKVFDKQSLHVLLSSRKSGCHKRVMKLNYFAT